MKKVFFVVLISLFAVGVMQAQVIETGDQAVNVGIGLGGGMVAGNGQPSIDFSYEVLPFEKLGIGYISVGGYGSYKHSSEDGVGYEWKYNYWLIGGRAAYHFDFYAMNHNDFFNHFDVYAGVFAGIKIERSEFDGDYTPKDDHNSTKPRTDIFAGCRYNFSDNLAAYAETSTGLSNLSIGLSFLF